MRNITERLLGVLVGLIPIITGIFYIQHGSALPISLGTGSILVGIIIVISAALDLGED